MARNSSRMPAPPSKAALEDNPELAQRPIDDLDGSPELDAASEEMPMPSPSLPKAPSRKKIKVIANRAGFINQERKVAGDKFEVHEHQLGSWMDCEDPIHQKNHARNLRAKKQEINRQAIADQDEELADE